MNQDYYNLYSVILICVNIVATVGISLISFSKTKRLQATIEKEMSNREILQREYDLRKDAVRNSEEKSIVLFNKIDELIELLKARNISDADSKLKIDMYKYYWSNVLFFPNELQMIYKRLTDLAIEAVVGLPNNNKEYYEILKNMNNLYFEYIQKFRDIYYYNNQDISQITKNQLMKIMNEMKEEKRRITIAST